MAVGAQPRWNCMRSSQLEPGRSVIERSIGPLHSVVTGFAGRGKTGSDVVHRR